MLGTIAREWGRIGVTGFGGPPAHLVLLRDLVVTRRGWMTAQDFEDANAACGLLPGPSSTQMAIHTAGRAGGRLGALVGGLCFIVPGVVSVLLLSLLFLSGSPPDVVLGAGAGAGAAVSAVAVQAALLLLVPGRARAPSAVAFTAYAAIGAIVSAALGAVVVVALLACGVVELGRRRLLPVLSVGGASPAGILAVAGSSGGIGALAWTALKVGALSYGGGFVIIPLMQHDAVEAYRWMTDAQFLNAVALGQITPGPVVATVTAVGYAAHGIGGALLASVVAFSPSFLFILLGADRFDELRSGPRVRAFLDGAGPAAAGAILGAAVPLALATQHTWQVPVLAAAALALLALRRGVVETLLGAAGTGVLLALLGAPV